LIRRKRRRAAGQVSSAQQTPQPLQGWPSAGLAGAAVWRWMVCSRTLRNEPCPAKLIKSSHLLKEFLMSKLISALLAAVFALSSVSALACGDKAKDEKQMSTPAKPKV